SACPRSSSRPSSPVGGPPVWRSCRPGNGPLPASEEPAMTQPKPHPAIRGSGPTGLEAALAAAEAGFPFTLYEAAPEVAGNIRAWGHVRLFTPWEMSASALMRQSLAAAGVAVPESLECPTGRE